MLHFVILGRPLMSVRSQSLRLTVTVLLPLLLASAARLSYSQVLGVQIPNSANAYNHDEIRTSSGISCRQASGSSTNVEFGIIGTDSESETDQFAEAGNSFGGIDTSGGAVYGRITYSIGAPERLDCSRLYELELEKLRTEVELLRMERQFTISDNMED